MNVFEDMFVNPSSHSRECLRQNRCVCGHFERQNADFEARLKRAMERYPEPKFNADAHRRFMRGL
jgi:hypothetical protein